MSDVGVSIEYFKSAVKSDSDIILVQCAQMTADVIAEASYEELIDIIIPGIHQLAQCDSPPANENIYSLMPDIAETIQDCFPDNAEMLIMNQILPLVHEAIENKSEYLDEFLAESFAALITIIETNDFITIELPHVIEFAKSSVKETRMIVTEFLSFLVDFFEPSLWYKQLFEIICTLSSDPLSSIRCQIPTLIAHYARRITTPREKAQFCGRMALFCRDSVTNVRIAAAKDLIVLSENLDPMSRFVTIFPALQVLINDPSEAVRKTISKHLGAIISTLGSKVDKSVVIKYCASLESEDSDMAFHAAFAFPAVALTLGESRWKEIKASFEHAIQSPENMVRRSLSFGLSSFAPLLDPEDLSRISLQFLNDLPAVGIGIISHISNILRFVNDREPFKPYISDPFKYNQWRIRLQISEQIRLCIDYLDRPFLIGIASQLIHDDVIAVRKDAVISLAKLMDNESTYIISDLANSDYFRDRICAAAIYQFLNTKLFHDDYTILEKLSKDPIPTVRIASAHAISTISKTVEDPVIDSILKVLRDDKDIDVKYAIGHPAIVCPQ